MKNWEGNQEEGTASMMAQRMGMSSESCGMCGYIRGSEGKCHQRQP